MRLALPAVLGVLMVLAVSQSSAQVTNGGFETSDYTGWTQFGSYASDGLVHLIQDSRYVYNGGWGAKFGAIYPEGSGITQAVPTLLATYDLSFEYRRVPDLGGVYPNYFRVSWGGTQLFEDTEAFDTLSPWFTKTFSVSGTGSPVELKFWMYNKFDYYALDYIRLVQTGPAAVPEPALVQLPFLMGLAGIGAWRRRRRS